MHLYFIILNKIQKKQNKQQRHENKLRNIDNNKLLAALLHGKNIKNIGNIKIQKYASV